MNAATVLEVNLSDWTAHYPTGVSLCGFDLDGKKIVIESAYCDDIDEFKEFINCNIDEMDKFDTQIDFSIATADILCSNVMDVASELARYCAEKLEEKEESFL